MAQLSGSLMCVSGKLIPSSTLTLPCGDVGTRRDPLLGSRDLKGTAEATLLLFETTTSSVSDVLADDTLLMAFCLGIPLDIAVEVVVDLLALPLFKLVLCVLASGGLLVGTLEDFSAVLVVEAPLAGWTAVFLAVIGDLEATVVILGDVLGTTVCPERGGKNRVKVYFQ